MVHWLQKVGPYVERGCKFGRRSTGIEVRNSSFSFLWTVSIESEIIDPIMVNVRDKEWPGYGH